MSDIDNIFEERDSIDDALYSSLSLEEAKEIEKLRLQHQWEKITIEAAISAMSATIGNSLVIKEIGDIAKKDGEPIEAKLVRFSIECADKLVEGLKEKFKGTRIY